MNAHGEGYVKGFLDAGSIPAGSTKEQRVPFGTLCSFFLDGIGANIEPVAHTHFVRTLQKN